jgi:uncharacterized protein YeaO (DUF488 family)
MNAAGTGKSDAPLAWGQGRCGRHAASAGGMSAMVQLKRVYEKPAKADGLRILVDRLWPRGLTKQRAAVDEWLKELAPSTELRKWFAHDPDKWKEFQSRYRKELQEQKEALSLLKEKSKEQTVTLVYGARDEEHNEAVVLKQVLDGRRR